MAGAIAPGREVAGRPHTLIALSFARIRNLKSGTRMDFTAPSQIVGYVAFALGIFAFAQRIDWRLKFLVASECVAYTLHFYLLGNNAAAVSAALSAMRTFTSLKTRSPWVAGFFLALNLVLGVAVATSWTAVFPIMAGLSGTVAVFLLRGIGMRLGLMCATLCWLTNNILSGSIGGTMLESSIAVVNATTMLRLWRAGRLR
ncbi:YgjV family protein [Solidesulfovibrio sp. C21]|uniref:YgjV family protein n=1 Tax=Solidesulfovibrio sp. C21 TaxID=3398613 RepID=UPI0039FC8524